MLGSFHPERVGVEPDLLARKSRVEECCKQSSTPSLRSEHGQLAICTHDDMNAFSSSGVTRIAQRGRALGDPTRVRILGVLVRGPQPVSRIVQALRADQSNVSRHLQVLFHAGLVTRERAAGAVIYALADRHVIELCGALAGRIGRSTR